MLVGKGMQGGGEWRGERKWDDCNSIINKLLLKKVKQNFSQKNQVMTDWTILCCTSLFHPQNCPYRIKLTLCLQYSLRATYMWNALAFCRKMLRLLLIWVVPLLISSITLTPILRAQKQQNRILMYQALS